MSAKDNELREWFHQFLNNDPKNAKKTVAQRKLQVKKQLPGILVNLPRGRSWTISEIQWTPPPPGKRYFITVLVKLKKRHPPDEAKVPPKPRTPPILM